MLGGSLVCLGLGALAARTAALTLPLETRSGGAQAVVWLALAAPVLLAFRRSRPRGLLTWRAVDALYGVVFGVVVRVAQGMLDGLGGHPAAWPSTFSVGGVLPDAFLLDALAGTAVSPLVEEFFFRAVVVVCAYTTLRRLCGQIAAGVAAAALSSGLFVVAHLLVGAPGTVDVLTLTLLGGVTGAFVLGTGRIWAAVFVHVIFNATGFALVAIGTLLA